MRNRLFNDSRARDCQEIEELRRICCEETNRARQLRIDELSMQQERNPSTVNQLMAQIQEMQDKATSLSDARECYDPETASSSGASLVPSQPFDYSESQRDAWARIWIAAGYIEYLGASGNVFESLLAREGPSSALCGNSLNLASSSCGMGSGTTGNMMEHGRGLRQEPQSSSTPTPHFNQGSATLNPSSHTRGAYSLNCVMVLLEIFNLGNASLEDSRNLWIFKPGKSTSRLKYVQNQRFFTSLCIRSKKLRWQGQ